MLLAPPTRISELDVHRLPVVATVKRQMGIEPKAQRFRLRTPISPSRVSFHAAAIHLDILPTFLGVRPGRTMLGHDNITCIRSQVYSSRRTYVIDIPACFMRLRIAARVPSMSPVTVAGAAGAGVLAVEPPGSSRRAFAASAFCLIAAA